ncbi:hypothetical protein [Snodgrassella communis]|uniref:hypothetical protein n=1 Tax=Snodgrassella communis TaxID=2946699 RepID=UPI000C1DCD46|nr:hypothetical protein [Snodgrassella communis]PIT23606.1 hypothetical protein BGI35_01640 [Snodgrassella communis]
MGIEAFKQKLLRKIDADEMLTDDELVDAISYFEVMRTYSDESDTKSAKWGYSICKLGLRYFSIKFLNPLITYSVKPHYPQEVFLSDMSLEG